jgi:hypothetical protein
MASSQADSAAGRDAEIEGEDISSSGDEKLEARPTAGVKRTLMTHTKDGKVLSEKKIRRLEKNRLSARECRRRKREATEDMEREINVMEAENLRLRLQLQIGKEAEESRVQDQEKLMQDINDLLKSGASEGDIHATLEEFKEKHEYYGKSRRSAIEFHLRNIERLLMPTQTTSVVMHAFQGGELDANASATNASAASVPFAVAASVPFASAMKAIAPSVPSPLPVALNTEEASKKQATPLTASSSSSASSPTHNFDPKALFKYLVNYLEVTPQQAAALKDSQRVSRELDGCLATSLSVVKELRDRLSQTGDDLETEFNNVRGILTPTQAAKFLVWVANNGACMHMLNELWDRVYPAGTFPSGDRESLSP